MVAATTPNFGFTQPEVGASANTWGDILNGDWSQLDTLLGAPKDNNARAWVNNAWSMGPVKFTSQVACDQAFIQTNEVAVNASTGFLLADNGSIRYLQWQSNYYMSWNIGNGTYSFVNNGAGIATLDAGGNFWTAGRHTAAGATLTGNEVLQNGTFTLWDTVHGGAAGFWGGSGNLNIGAMDGNGNPQVYWGAFTPGGNLAVQGACNSGSVSTGNVSASGSINANGAITSAGNLNCNSGRIIVAGGGDPSVTMWNQGGGYAFGWRCYANQLVASTMDGGGNGQSDILAIDSDGNAWVGGNFNVRGTGIQYAYAGGQHLHAQEYAQGYLWPVVDGGANLGHYQTTGSDIRIKRNIHDAGDALGEIMRMRVVGFDRLMMGEILHFDFGLIADELVEVAPDSVCIPVEEARIKSLDLMPLLARCIRAIQQLQAEITELKGQTQ